MNNSELPDYTFAETGQLCKIETGSIKTMNRFMISVVTSTPVPTNQVACTYTEISGVFEYRVFERIGPGVFKRVE